MKIDSRMVLTLALGTAIGTLVAVWLSPIAKRMPPKEKF